MKVERAIFRFVEDEKPGFTVNTVNPFFVIGPTLNERHLKGTAGWIRNVYNGEPGLLAVVPPSKSLWPAHTPPKISTDDLSSQGCQVNVQDVAALHVAAALEPDVSGERLLAFGEPFNLNLVLAILRRQYPDRELIDDLPSQQLCLARIGNESRLLGLLKKLGGRNGWITLQQGVREGLSLDS